VTLKICFPVSVFGWPGQGGSIKVHAHWICTQAFHWSKGQNKLTCYCSTTDLANLGDRHHLIWKSEHDTVLTQTQFPLLQAKCRILSIIWLTNFKASKVGIKSQVLSRMTHLDLTSLSLSLSHSQPSSLFSPDNKFFIVGSHYLTLAQKPMLVVMHSSLEWVSVNLV